MPDPAREFAQAVDRVYDRANRWIRSVIIQADTNLVTRTPVDTGRARSNWRIGVNGRVAGIVAPRSPNAAIAEAESRARRFTPFAFRGNGDREANITNNVSYIGDLNRGRSRQAPAGFVQDSIISAFNSVPYPNR